MNALGLELGIYTFGEILPDPHTGRTVSTADRIQGVLALAKLADEAGISLIEMAIAFVLRHPAITAAIIGPRTMEQLESQLSAAEVELSDDVLDRIDEIVPPGVNLNPADGGYQNPDLEPAARRRQRLEKS